MKLLGFEDYQPIAAIAVTPSGVKRLLSLVDEAGKFTISVCSGHQGGADSLTQAVAAQIGATPVLTGASSALKLPGIDVLGVPFGWNRGEGQWTAVSAAIARKEPVEVIQEVGCTLWQENLPENHPFILELQDDPKPAKARVWISAMQRQFAPNSEFPKVQWHPRVLWVGVGCERGTSRQVVETAIAQVCQSRHFAQGAIAGIATIDSKADEVGLLELCEARQWPLKTFPSEVLKSVTVPTPSTVVAQKIGTPSVAEAAAIVAAQGWTSSGETRNSLLVPKQIFRLEGEPGAVTVAIAQAEQEYTGREGKQ
ncbi:cobalt-precorrin 5A hydrolase [Laspinema palackyanum]|uniref:cobalt-precorrin 5A hydrolase n=1 Tax=Laspinema palackyanum TaxID=3231601 RepID=UPI00345C87CC|nr:cobalamin biosynthesis protein [Laspinema sp. D2c]